MFAGLRPRGPRHGTIVAYLALFVALGGSSAYAANEWTGTNIVDESLTGVDIKGKGGTASTPAVNGSITTFDVAGQPANANGTPFVDGTLTTWDIKNQSLRQADLADGSIGNAQLGSDAVAGDKVADGSLSGADLAAGSIGNTQLGSDAVAGDKVADGSLSGSDVLDESLTNADIGPSAVGTSEIATDGVGATEVQDNSIDAGEIVDNSLIADDLAAGSVGTSELQSNAVGSSNVTDNSLTLSDLKGANVQGAVSFTAGGIPIGGCKDFAVSTSGTKVGEAVLVSLRGPAPAGMVFYGVGVAVDSQTTLKVCNFTGASSPAITSLPVRVVSFG